MKKILLSAFILFVGLSNVFATHNRAGEITYKWIGDALHPYKYHITVTTYTKWLSLMSTDRCELTVQFGDGDSAVAPRTNGITTGTCAPEGDGVMMTTAVATRYNTYETDHNYTGPGNFFITMEDQNRNGGICNIPDSDNQSFFLRTEIVLSPFLGHNDSPVLLNAPIDDACVGVCFEHNPGAYDADGDSLSFSLSTCYAFGVPIPGWHYPDNMNSTDINPYTGQLDWCSPPMICQYNIAIVVKEYRLIHGTNTRYYIGSVLRDMQINVLSCSNTPPQINAVNDTCVIAGNNLDFNVNATDVAFNIINLTATGGPLVTPAIMTPPATFSATSILGSPSTATGIFHWTPSCSEVRLLPYLITFKATDTDPTTPLVSFESMFIKVIAPAPTGLTAVPSGASIILNWNQPFCDSTGPNPLKKYYIYRKNSCDPWTPGPCETGVPSYVGYTLIGTTIRSILTFTDNNGGAGLTNGIDYSYIVVAYYNDGSQSIASQHVCARLVRDVPIITNVSVISTGTNDSIWTHWVKPLATLTNLDTIANPPPYEYKLMRAQGFTGALTYSQIALYTYPAFWQMTDTGFISSGINTQDSAYTYRVDFYSNGILKGSTNTASSVFLSSTPGDKKVNLSWQQYVPWVNYRYKIYRETSPGSGSFTFIDSTTNQTFVDSNLVNEVNYCYRVLSIGEYSDTTLPKPLRNYSEIKCETPVDLIPPCQPNFDIATSCDALENIITWTLPGTYCNSGDAVQINIYFAPTVFDPLQIIYTTTNMSITSYTHSYLYDGTIPSVAGCYAVTAVDSALSPNESPILNKICIDNCPSYELPNVFTPNGDGANDLFTPLPDYRFVKDVDIKIFDRWGLQMFETNNPDVLWDGKNQQSKKLCPDGTYFYICVVDEIRIDGIKPRVIKGFVQLIQDKTKPAR